MRLLLDTHTILWWALTMPELSRRARTAIESPDNEIFVSAVAAMEIATKVRIGKLEIARPLATGFAAQVEERGLDLLDLTAHHAELAGSIVSPHNDPWDRLLAAQARIERLTVVTRDAQIAKLGAATYW